MRWILCVSLALCLQANVLDLPVRYDPFTKAKKIIKQKSQREMIYSAPAVHFDLTAIFNDKAYINGKFYTIGQKIDGYRLVDIKERYVVLRRGRDVKIVPLVKKRILKTSER